MPLGNNLGAYSMQFMPLGNNLEAYSARLMPQGYYPIVKIIGFIRLKRKGKWVSET